MPKSWQIEMVEGCNLACGHCATRTLPPGRRFMSRETWYATWDAIREYSPNRNVTLSMAGEPTLHPSFLEFVARGRDRGAGNQINLTTNGIGIERGEFSFVDLFSAGVNVIFVDVYGDWDWLKARAAEVGVEWYVYLEQDGTSPYAHHGPDTQLIVLMHPPRDWLLWPVADRKRKQPATHLNNLNWDEAREYGLEPVETAPAKRCMRPFREAVVLHNGDLGLCCQDFHHEAAHGYGNIHDGEFLDRWLGDYMQEQRRLLREKRRPETDLCRRCGIVWPTTWRLWSDEILNRSWNGHGWHKRGARS